MQTDNGELIPHPNLWGWVITVQPSPCDVPVSDAGKEQLHDFAVYAGGYPGTALVAIEESFNGYVVALIPESNP